MKKWTLFLSVYLCLCLLVSCGAAPGSGGPVPGGMPSEEPQRGGEAAQPVTVTETFRIVETEDGALPVLLAKVDGGDVLRLGQADAEVLLDGAPAADVVFRPGALLEVTYDGTVLETFPAQFANVSSLNLRSDGFDDRCRLYLDVLNDLWAVDPGLHEGITELGVDLSQTGLSASERSAVAWAFGQAHGLVPVEGTWQELIDQGYITGEPLGEDAPEDAKFWQWEKGCLFSITEQEDQGGGAPSPLAFEAQKWRSGLGAYFFTGCTAHQSADGSWGDYTVGAEAIA